MTPSSPADLPQNSDRILAKFLSFDFSSMPATFVLLHVVLGQGRTPPLNPWPWTKRHNSCNTIYKPNYSVSTYKGALTWLSVTVVDSDESLHPGPHNRAKGERRGEKPKKTLTYMSRSMRFYQFACAGHLP